MKWDHSNVIDATQIVSSGVKIGDYGFFGYYPLTLKKSVENDSEKMKGIVTAIHDGENWCFEKNNNTHNKFALFYPLPNPQEQKHE